MNAKVVYKRFKRWNIWKEI